MLRCPTCAETYPSGTRFCRLDGTRLVDAVPTSERTPEPSAPDGLICPTCGATSPPGARFCRLDGSPLVATAPAARPRVRPLTVHPLEMPAQSAAPAEPEPSPSPPEDDPLPWAPPHAEATAPPPVPPAETALDALALLLGMPLSDPAAAPAAAAREPEQLPAAPVYQAVPAPTEVPPVDPEPTQAMHEDVPAEHPADGLVPDAAPVPDAEPVSLRPAVEAAVAAEVPVEAEVPAEPPPLPDAAQPEPVQTEPEPADGLFDLSPLDPVVSEPDPFEPSPYAPLFNPPFQPLDGAEPPDRALAEMPDGSLRGEEGGERKVSAAPRRSPGLMMALIIGLILLAMAIGTAAILS